VNSYATDVNGQADTNGKTDNAAITTAGKFMSPAAEFDNIDFQCYRVGRYQQPYQTTGCKQPTARDEELPPQTRSYGPILTRL
jgi:hypothetical protein